MKLRPVWFVFALLLLPAQFALAAWTQATGTAGIRFVSMSKVGTTLYAGASTGGPGLFQSTDDGATWTTAFGGYFNTWTPQVVTQIGSVLYVGGTVNYTAAHLAYSTNGGTTWTDLTGSWGGATTITAIAQMNGATFVSAYGKGVYKSTTNDGTGWVLSNTGMTTQGSVKGLAQLGTDIYVADATNNGSDGVYKSSNNGASWARLATSPSGNGGAVSGFLNYNGTLMFAGGSGVWRSPDGGANWTKVNTSNSYAFEYNNATLYLVPATGGNSLLTSTDGTTWTSQDVTSITAPYLQPGIVISGGKLLLDSGNGIWRENDPAPSYALVITTPTNGTVSSDIGGISCGTGCTGHYVSGASVQLTATPDSGYVLSSWGGSCSGNANPLTVTITADMSCSATFGVANVAPTASAVAITGAVQVGSLLTGSYTYADADGDIEGASTFRWVSNTVNTGVTGGNTVATTQDYTPLAADAGLYLYFCVTPVASTGTSPGTEACSSATAQVPTPVDGVCGSDNGQTLVAPPTINRCVAGLASAVTEGTSSYTWSCDGTAGSTVNAACAAIRNYLVTPSAGANGSISPSTVQQVAYNATPGFTLTPNTGYTASGGGTCGGSLSNNTYTTVGITANCTVVASFTLKTYAITATASPASGGTASCTPNPANHGSSSTCTATPNTGYTFASWSGDCAGQGATCTLSNITAARNSTAQFQPATTSQSNIPTQSNGVSATLDVTGCTAIDSAVFVTAPAGAPVGTSFPFGLLDFVLSGCTGTVSVTVTYSQPLPAHASFYKYLNGSYAGYNASLSTNSVTFTLTDGGAGDADGSANGSIHDPSGIGVAAAAVATTGIPTLSEWAMYLLSILVAMIGAAWFARRHDTAA